MDPFKNSIPTPDALAADSGMSTTLDKGPDAYGMTNSELVQGFSVEPMDQVDTNVEFPQPGFAWSRMGD